MAQEPDLSRDAFLYLAGEAGLDVNSGHMDELYAYVRVVLNSLRSLHDLDVADAEPDMAFIPPVQ